MKKLFLFLCSFFDRLFGHSVKPEESSSVSKGPEKNSQIPTESSNTIYRTPAEKSEPEPDPVAKFFDAKPWVVKPLPPLEPLKPLPPLPPLPPLLPLAPSKMFKFTRPAELPRGERKPVVGVKLVTRDEALKLSHLPLTNDITAVGDDTIHVPILGGKGIEITPKYFEPETESKIVLEKEMEQKISESEEEGK